MTDTKMDLWKQSPETIKSFIELQSSYKQLASEVSYILETRLKKTDIKYSSISFREKELNSFIEKISRKKYKSPLNDITDFAGVRIVYLYSTDFELIENIIISEFEVLEKVDKLAEQGPDKFGYGAVHYIVKLGTKSSGARYDDLKDLKCEIQIRTVLQDAWSIVNHHLLYKREDDIPPKFRRKVNSLAGLFETADDQFVQIRKERELYLKEVEDYLTNVPKSEDQDINIDSMTAFLSWKLPGMELMGFDDHLSWVLNDINKDKYKKLSDIESLFSRTKAACDKYYEEEASKLRFAAGYLAVALAFDDPGYRGPDGWDDDDIPLFEKYEHLVKK